MIEIKTISSYDEWLDYKNAHDPYTVDPRRACPESGDAGAWSLRKTPHKYIFQVSATWCKPCVALKPLLLDFLDSLKENLSQNISFIMLDYDIYNEDTEFQQIFSIKKIPHFSFYFQDKSINDIETSKFEEVKEQIINFIKNNYINNDINNDINNINNFTLSEDF